MPEENEVENLHLTTRRGFIILCSLAVTSLYALWAAYGAVPTSLGLAKQPMQVGVQGTGQGPALDTHMPHEEFRRLTQAFVDANKLPDGSVRPALKIRDKGESFGVYIGDPVDVYIMARQYSYFPAVLRLERDVPYRFRIMSMDTDHGASIQFQGAAHMIRAPVEHVVEKLLVFKETGEYPVYCTVYCGLGHDLMKGRIFVD